MGYPAIEEVFALRIEGDAPENQPLEMVKREGYDRPMKWKHAGSTVNGRQACRFKLVCLEARGTAEDLAPPRTFEEVRSELASHGRIPEGQWRMAYKAAYPECDGKGPVGIADPSWQDSSGSLFFPCVDWRGRSDLASTAEGFDLYWRWLVEVND
ncbi:MAG: hypothetical protein Q7S89_00535 [bacterium]|nr:hypothetical protein [bacterium]